MGELQHLPSSMREKTRYIIFEILADEDIGFGAFVDRFWDAMIALNGEKGVAEADPWLLKDMFDEDALRGGIRVNKDMVEEVRAALALITRVKGTPVTIQVLGVTGTIDSARSKYLSTTNK